ncbi:MAG: bacillithiol biosynthesis cysteine-adding enzyme BshC [Gemmatimonadales bacterium]
MVRIVAHPLGPLVPIPPRVAAWRPELDAAVIDAAGAEAAIARLHEDGAVAVTTGQQPGLFTGPLYSIHKALAATALARGLERRWRRPVVPIFWIAGDDHDYIEGSLAAWLGADGEVVEWRLPARPPSAPQLSLSQLTLPDEIDAGIALLAGSLPRGQPRDMTMAWIGRHYTAGATLHAACAGALAELLAPFGIVCFDPTHPAAKRVQAPLLRRAIEHAAEIDAALKSIPDPGTGVRTGDGATLVFVNTDAGRERLMIDGDAFRTRRSGIAFGADDLVQLIQGEPERFSANVLLRPVIEAALLPTVAYVAGPAELTYLRSQSATLYPLFDVTPQVPVPRWSGATVPHWAERLLHRLDLTAETVIADDSAAARAVLDRDFPHDARQAIDALHAQVGRGRDLLIDAGRRIDPVLDAAMVNRLRRLDELIDDLDAVLRRHLRKRSDIAYAQYRRLTDVFRPLGQPQERVLTAATFLGRYGDAWTNAVFESVTTWTAGLPPETM